MNHILEYRQAMVKAKIAWDELLKEAKSDKQLVDLSKKRVIENGDSASKLILKKQKDLSIYGGAIALLSKAKHEPVLLYSPEIQLRYGFNDNKDFEFLDTPYSTGEIIWKIPNLHYFIDLLFFIARKKEYPEYVAKIKEETSIFEYPFQSVLRRNYEILHCTTGEILFFLFSWRSIILLIKQNKDAKLKLSNLNVFDAKIGSKDVWTWEILFDYIHKDCIEKEITKYFKPDRDKSDENNIHDIAIKEAKELLENISEGIDNFESIFRNIGFFDALDDKHLVEFNKYAQFIFKDEAFILRNNNVECYSIQFLNKLQKIIYSEEKDPDHTFEEILIKLHDVARFPILPYYFLMSFDKEHKLKEHLAFPIWYTFSPDTQYDYAKKSKIESAILHGLYTIKPIWEVNEIRRSSWYTKDNSIDSKELESFFEEYLTDLFSFFTAMSKPIIDKEYYAEQRKNDIGSIKKEATRAAISQVMARNSSHNIGSHVMNKLINGKTLKELNLVKLYSKKSKDQKFNYHSLIEIEDLGVEAETYNQFAIFNNYVKCRMDYLSDITFGTPIMQTTKKVYDLFEELDKVRLLLENISGLTEFHYQIQFTFNGGDIDKNLSLALPNDILGSQALYNIIENVIRNTAKHSKGKSKVPVDATTGKKLIIFTINIKEIEKGIPVEVQCAECYEVEIFDNVPVATGYKEFKTKDEINELKDYVEDYNKDNDIKISEATPVSNIAYLVHSQNKKLNDSILQDNNSLRASGLGLIEMEASASYLRKLDISNIEGDAYNIDYNDAIYNEASKNLNIVKAFKAGKDNNYLGYRFFMLRPAEVLVVADIPFKENIAEEWLKVGVKIISLKQFNENVYENGFLKDVYNHQFFVCNESSVLSIALKNTTSLPLRIIEHTEIENQLLVVDLNTLLKFLWELWERQINNSEAIIFKEFSEQKKDTNHIVILDHFGDTDDDKIQWDSLYKNEKIIQLEALSSLAQNKLPNFAKINRALSGYLSFIKDINGSPLQLETSMIKECAFSKVLVIDERIQTASYVEDLKISKRQIYEKMNLIILDNSEYNLGIDDFNEVFSIYLLNHIFNTCLNMDPKRDFVLIHYSILERCFNGNNIVLKNCESKNIMTIENYLKELSKKINVVITSGRGTPQNLPLEVRYINLSPVITAFVEIRSKYFINYLLHSSRKSNRI